MEIVAVDLGGTNARFCVARLDDSGRPALDAPRKYRTADYPGLPAAWRAFERDSGGRLPKAASIAIAGPVEGELIHFTNSSWTIRPGTLGADLDLDRPPLLINDFAAMAAAVGTLRDEELAYIGGPEGPLPAEGITTVIGPGTGLGVAQLLRWQGRRIVLPTEGGHLDFAALDSFEEKLLSGLRERFVRVSIERIVSGPGLSGIREALARLGGEAIVPLSDALIWEHAVNRTDRLADQALDRFVMSFGAVAGDLALAHGAHSVAITGGLSNRIRDRLAGPLFNDRFRAKGRFAQRMASFPIRLAIHPEPGLLGAAAAYQEQRL